MSAIAPDTINFQGVSYGITLGTDGKIDSATPTLTPSSEAPTSLSLPAKIFEEIGLDLSANVRVSLAVFQDDTLFQAPMSPNTFVSSLVISASVSTEDMDGEAREVKVDNLENNVAMEFGIKSVSGMAHKFLVKYHQCYLGSATVQAVHTSLHDIVCFIVYSYNQEYCILSFDNLPVKSI